MAEIRHIPSHREGHLIINFSHNFSAVLQHQPFVLQIQTALESSNAMEKTKSLAIPASFILFLSFAADLASAEQNHRSNDDMSKHFVLVHGSCFGAWSWYKVVPLLKSAGHKVTAIDLASSGINFFPAADVHSISDYSRPLMILMKSIPSNKKVILVGHSSGGAVISQAMEFFPKKVSVGVFVTAGMPGPSLNYSTISQKISVGVSHALDNKFIYDRGPNKPPTAFIFGPKFLSQVVFQYSPTEEVDLAKLLLRSRPMVSPEGLVLSEAKYGSVSRVYIVSEEDRIVTADVVKLMVQKNPPNCILNITSSDHMVMLSQPTQLFAHLVSIARDYS